MLAGVYNTTGGPASDLGGFARLRALAGEAPLEVHGPLGVTVAPDSLASPAAVGHVGALSCVMDGSLYPLSDPRAEPDEDARALALAYAGEGRDALARLRGRFAAALWDREENRGILTCDVLATRQLFVYRCPGALIFAGEIRELLALLASRPGPDPIGFASWLADGTIPEGLTLYDGVTRLGPGELLELEPGSPRTQIYWRPRFTGTLPGRPAELAEGLRLSLQSSARARLSPTANAVILSGGLDSSIVTAVAERERRPEAALRTYSGVFPGTDYDESEKIHELTSALGVAGTTLQIKPQGTVWLALEHVKSWQLPLIAAGSLIDIAATAEAAADGAEVLLDGQTGDEVLGFSPYLIADMLRRGRLLAAVDLADQWPLGRRTTARNKLWILRELGIKGGAPHGLGQFVRNRRDHGDAGPDWLRPGPRRTAAGLEDRWAWKQRSSGPLWWRHLADVLVSAPHRELRLEYLRHRASAAGVVNESALYDVDLIQYCLRLPPEIQFDWRYDRPLVREAMRGWLPEAIRLQTRKADFTRFCRDAMIGADGPATERLVTAPDAEVAAYVDMDWVANRLHRLQSGQVDPMAISTIWRVAAAECWLRSQADPGFADELLAADDVLPPAVTTGAPA